MSERTTDVETSNNVADCSSSEVCSTGKEGAPAPSSMEKRRARQRRYAANWRNKPGNRERGRRYSQEYRREHKEQVAAYDREYKKRRRAMNPSRRVPNPQHWRRLRRGPSLEQ